MQFISIVIGRKGFRKIGLKRGIVHVQGFISMVICRERFQRKNGLKVEIGHVQRFISTKRDSPCSGVHFHSNMKGESFIEKVALKKDGLSSGWSFIRVVFH